MSTTTEQQPAPDYGEPWRRVAHSWAESSLYDSQQNHLIVHSIDDCRTTEENQEQRESEQKVLLERIISCVNACAGMADPAKEIPELKAYAQRCKDGCISLSHSIDRIDYACGEPNEMEVSDYCIHQNDEAVVERVKAKMAEIQAMRAELADIRQHLKGHPDSSLDGENGLAAATMRGFDGLQAENEAMREAINAAHAALTNVSPVFGRTPAQDAALAKLQPFLP